MADYSDIDFVNKISYKLDRFSVKNTNPYKANFRCPFCLDSKKSKLKARGWLLEENNKLFFYCHNCFETMTFYKFLQRIDYNIYKDYLFDKFASNKTNTNEVSFDNKVKIKSENSKILFIKHDPIVVKKMESNVDSNLKKIQNLTDLEDGHVALKYVKERKIPETKYNRFYYTPHFKKWVNTLLPDKFANIENDEPRLVIPFCDYDGIMFGFTGRSLDQNSDMRYISIMLDTNKDKIYGLNEVNFEEKYYVFEGAIDSMFVENSCAMAGADMDFKKLKNHKNAVIVYDNEPRNKEIHKKMESAIKNGMSIVIWPNSLEEKDVNNMVLYEKKTPEEIAQIINDNTFYGMEAMMRFNSWKKTSKKTENDDSVYKELKKIEIKGANSYKW